VRALLLATVVAALAGCGGEAGGVPAPLPSSALPELEARERELPRDELAADAYEPAELARLLDEAGYEGGRERELTGHTDTFDHVVARVLAFDTPAGATAYVTWVSGHVRELAGPAREIDALPLGDESRRFELEPCPTCKKQLPTQVAVWRRGSSVRYLLAAGRGLSRATVLPLAGLIDEAAGSG
jgi:hypothetical protein